jgi:hypothetical protein
MARRIAIVLVLLAAASLLAAADEVVKFKNGHTMLVRESRLEGAILYVTLKDGSVLGFPKDLIQIPPEKTRRVYRDKNTPAMKTSSGGRGPRGRDLQGYRAAIGETVIGQGSLGRSDSTARYSRQVGYYRPRGGEANDEGGPRRKKAGVPIQDLLEEQLSRRGGGGAAAPSIVGTEGPNPDPEPPSVEVRVAPAKSRTGRVVDDR